MYQYQESYNVNIYFSTVINTLLLIKQLVLLAERHWRRQRHLESADPRRGRGRRSAGRDQPAQTGPLPAKLRPHHQRQATPEMGLRAARSHVQPQPARRQRPLERRGERLRQT